MSESSPRRWRNVQDALQRTSVRWWCSVAVSLLVVVLMAPFLVQAISLDVRRQAIVSALQKANLVERDPVSVALLERGEVIILQETFSSERLKRIGEELFDRKGAVMDPLMVSEVLLLPRYPEWSPPFLVESVQTPCMVTGVLIASSVGAVWLGLLPGYLFMVTTGLIMGIAGVMLDRPAMTFVATGLSGLVVSFTLLMKLLLVGLSGKPRWMAVAQTVVRESVRLRISVAFIVVLLVALPLIPVFIDHKSPLRYQIQSFMARSLDLTYVCAACMTLTLGCATVAFEIRDRQIWQLLTKPLPRLQYLLGKWVGIVTMNAVLLVVSGVGIFLFVQWMRTRPALDELDRLAVRDEVMVARESAFPPYHGMTRDQLLGAVDAAIASDAILKADIQEGRKRIEDVRRDVSAERQKDFLASQRMVGPGESKTLVFSGLQGAKRPGHSLTLRFLLHAGGSDTHSVYPVVFRFRDGSWIDRKFVPATSSVIAIPSDLIDEEGKLSIELMNLEFDATAKAFQPGEFTFNWDADAVELFYRVGGFEANYLRGMAVNLVKLSFLAMLAVCSATILSFPVACLLSFAVFLAGSMTQFLAESIRYQSLDLGSSMVAQVVATIIYALANSVEFLLRPFGETSANESLVRGINVGWDEVMRALAVVGVVWTGATRLIGWLAFRRKELAIYSGQG